MIDYETLTPKPTINGVELTGEMDLSDIGIVEMPPEMVTEIVEETFGNIL
jgi:hypothetical protein